MRLRAAIAAAIGPGVSMFDPIITNHSELQALIMIETAFPMGDKGLSESEEKDILDYAALYDEFRYGIAYTPDNPLDKLAHLGQKDEEDEWEGFDGVIHEGA